MHRLTDPKFLRCSMSDWNRVMAAGRWRSHRRETTLRTDTESDIHSKMRTHTKDMSQGLSFMYLERTVVVYERVEWMHGEKRINWLRLSLHAMCIRLAAADTALSNRNAWTFCAASFGIYAIYYLLLIYFLFPLIYFLLSFLFSDYKIFNVIK